MFDVVVMYHSVLNSCFLDAGTLSRIVHTYETVVMYAIVLIGYLYLLCFLSIKKNINLTLMNISLKRLQPKVYTG